MPGTVFEFADVPEVSEWHVQRKDLSEHPFKFDRATCVRFAQALLRECHDAP
jgi:hypothetical protein